MKIYKVWTGSNHKTVYILGHFLKKEDAERAYKKLTSKHTGTSPASGIEEIDVILNETNFQTYMRLSRQLSYCVNSIAKAVDIFEEDWQKLKDEVSTLGLVNYHLNCLTEKIMKRFDEIEKNQGLENGKK